MRKVVEEEPIPPSRIAHDDLRLTSARASQTAAGKARGNRKSKIVNPSTGTWKLFA